MAKKSIRRSRSKKEQTAKSPIKQPKKQTGASKPTVQATPPPKKRPAAASDAKPLAVPPIPLLTLDEAKIIRRQRRWPLVVVIGIVAVTLVLAVIVGVQARQHAATDTAPPGQDSAKADALLQEGGRVCVNGGTSTDNTGSTDPQSAGMTLQNVPVNDIQTPQGLATHNSDLNTLQAASCF